MKLRKEEVGRETQKQRDADSRVEVEKGVIDRRGLFAFVVPTSFISGEQPPSAERLYDRNQSEGNRPYTSTDAPTHRYRLKRGMGRERCMGRGREERGKCPDKK